MKNGSHQTKALCGKGEARLKLPLICKSSIIRAAAYAAACALFILIYAGVFSVNTAALSAASAILYEPASGRVLFERDAHKQRTMASTTKIMTALVGLEALSDDTDIAVPDAAVRVEGSALGLRGGDHITMGDLVTGMMLSSGNDAANTVAYAVAGGLPEFAVLMNQKAAELGMKDSRFVTPSGLDAVGHVSTAYDMALLAAAAMENPRFAAISAKQSAVIQFGNPPRGVTVSNHNKLLRIYDGAIGVKTGFTTKSGRCLVSAAQRDGIRIIAVTLDAPDDWNDHAELLDKGFAMLELVQPDMPELPLLPVAGSDVRGVALTSDAPPSQVMLKNEADRVTVYIELPSFIYAPVCAGEQVGTVQYEIDGRVIFTSPVYTAESAAALPVGGYWHRFSEWIGILIDSMY